MNISIPDKVRNIMKKVEESGAEIFIVGGAVRDGIMGIPPNDYDLFTNITGEEILKIFPHGVVIGGKERQDKILTVVVNEIELSSYRSNGERTETGGSLEDHLKSCDLTINSIAMDINGNITDPHFGRLHIADKIIRCVGNAHDRVEEDKLRVFRIIRFSLRFGFDIDKTLSDVIWDTDISNLPVERIREELLKIIMYHNGLSVLEQSGLLEKIIPEFTPCCLLNGGKHHNEYVNEHLNNAQNIARKYTDNEILILTCAMHDIGKGSSHQTKSDGDISFHEHEKIGRGIMLGVMYRMKFSNDDVNFVTTLISEHMMFWNIDGVSNKALIRHFTRLEDAGIKIDDLMVMMYADSQGNAAVPRMKFADFIRDNPVREAYYKLKYSPTPFRVPDLEISGVDIIELGVEPGPEIGRILQEIFDRVVAGELENRHGALLRFAHYYIMAQ